MRFKVTGFTRFLLVMLILAPLAYVVASYVNGKNGVEELKKLLSGWGGLSIPVRQDSVPKEQEGMDIQARENQRLLELTIQDMKDSILEKELEIRGLRRDLRRCKGK